MKSLKKFVLRIVLLVGGLYILFLILIYFFQEKLLFPGQPVAQEYMTGTLPAGVEEKLIPVDDGVSLHGLLFKSAEGNGLVFYLHGNGGNAYGWGERVAFITNMGYDVFVLDYRGYGKSGGSISSQQQLFSDVEKAYAQVCKPYKGKPVVIAGYSIGTGIATHLAMGKKIKALILQAPYYSLADLTDEKLLLIPDFIKKYTIRTNEWIGRVQAAPVYIFHGTGDELIVCAFGKAKGRK